jgi:transcriptional regulator with XRE-family HTH domain
MNATPSAYIEHHATVADNVRAEVARRRASQSEIAEALGLHQAGVSRRLSGRTEWTGSELATLAEVLQVPVSAFFPQSTFVPEATPPAVSVTEAPTSPALDAVPDPGVEGRGTSASASVSGSGAEDSSAA